MSLRYVKVFHFYCCSISAPRITFLARLQLVGAARSSATAPRVPSSLWLVEL